MKTFKTIAIIRSEFLVILILSLFFIFDGIKVLFQEPWNIGLPAAFFNTFNGIIQIIIFLLFLILMYIIFKKKNVILWTNIIFIAFSLKFMIVEGFSQILITSDLLGEIFRSSYIILIFVFWYFLVHELKNLNQNDLLNILFLSKQNPTEKKSSNSVKKQKKKKKN